MTRKSSIQILLLVVASAIAAYFVVSKGPVALDEHGEHDEAGADDDNYARGAHGGRLFVQDGLQAELRIFEAGVPPRWQVYASLDGTALPDAARVIVYTSRLGAVHETFPLTRQGEFWSSEQEVVEPHSFDVTLAIESGASVGRWSYQQHEGRMELDEGALPAAGIRLGTVQACKIEPTMRVSGMVVPDPQRTAHLSARYDGVVRTIHTHIGDQVRRGKVMAQIEGNESLSNFNIVSSLTGVVTDMHVALSESVGPDDVLFTVADLSEVWVELAVPVAQAGVLVPRAPINIHLPDGSNLRARIAHVAPTVSIASQSVEAHAEIDNREGRLRPGAYVDVDLALPAHAASLCVEQGAIQAFRDWTVVFVRYGTTFEVRPVELGARDNQRVEIVRGLVAQEPYAAEGSFQVKADILKRGASHDH